jgi:hypothetical protein
MRIGWNDTSRIVQGLLSAVLVPTLMMQARPSRKDSPGASVLHLGERMYREGLLPSGAPTRSFVASDLPVQGTTFACASCHLRSGMGASEGGILTLPANGASLFHPSFRNLPGLTPAERDQLSLQTVPSRPAYTDGTLATALRTGQDPTGRELSPVMPRYEFSDREAAILIAYLHTLSAEFSPGVDDTTLRLATVITDDVSLADRQSMVRTLDDYVRFHNQLRRGLSPWMSRSKSGNEMLQGFRHLTLAQWILKGSPRTWPRQLAAYYRENPVFALVGGISHRDWKPIHAFCEHHRIPCILPLTDLPALSDSDWYTLYFSRGLYQEGQAAAHYLAHQVEPSPDRKILQIAMHTPEGAALSTGFRDAWRELGRGPVREISLARSVKGALPSMIRREKPAAVLLWAGPEVYKALREVAESPEAPGLVIMSSSLLVDRLEELPDAARSATCLTYPFRHPDDEGRHLRDTNAAMAALANRDNASRIATRAHSLVQVLDMGLSEMGRHFYRDNLLDRISMLPDQPLADYERLSFGPGQRYASKGCYIMQLSNGAAPVLVKKSGWVVQ